MKIHVTSDDIANGKRGCPGSCPIARAIERQFQCDHLFVGGHRVTIHGPNISGTYSLPTAAKLFISAFDNNEYEVKPFSFNLGVTP